MRDELQLLITYSVRKSARSRMITLSKKNHELFNIFRSYGIAKTLRTIKYEGCFYIST